MCVSAFNGLTRLVLLDTGSQITSISSSFYNNYLADCVIHPLESCGGCGRPESFISWVR